MPAVMACTLLKTLAVTVQRPNFEGPNYCTYCLIPEDVGHKQVSAAVSCFTKLNHCDSLKYHKKQGQSRECRVNNYGSECLKGGKLAISSGFANRLFPMNPQRPPMTKQEVTVTNEILHERPSHNPAQTAV